MPDSPAFNPPALQPKDTDPMVMKVNVKEVEWAARESQQPSMRQELPISHVRNGQ